MQSSIRRSQFQRFQYQVGDLVPGVLTIRTPDSPHIEPCGQVRRCLEMPFLQSQPGYERKSVGPIQQDLQFLAHAETLHFQLGARVLK